MRKFSFILFAFFLLSGTAYAQQVVFPENIEIDYNNPQTYIIGGVSCEGTNYLSPQQLISLSGLRAGQQITIPSADLSSILKRIWKQRFFEDVGLYVDSITPTRDSVFLRLQIQERPRVSIWAFSGLRKGEQDDLKDMLSLRRGGELSEYVINSSTDIIKKYMSEKGFLNAVVDVVKETDTLINNAVKVTFAVDRGDKIKIKNINYIGAEGISRFKLDKSMKKTKANIWYNIFNSKKFNEEEFVNDKDALIEYFNELGYRDAKIVSDSIYYVEPKRLGIDINIDRGKQYYFRNITWTGNSIYTAEYLQSLLRINKGDVYDIVSMNKRLNGGGKETDIVISNLFRDNGYLFFSATPVETTIVGDSVDVEIRIVEGEQATFNNVIISGNDVTNEHVIRRAVYTRPGYLYSQSDFERSIRELGNMTNFDAEKITQQGSGWNLIPNPIDNTVDISFNVVEKSNSQLELSGGWGGGMFVGSVGINFSNFSTRNLF
ncbi:MAG: outer membrane protein assembly factor BamA, partial [Bacteroidales bacterium]|nr:outer membrane protein assembly factor BamA [Bacteroidales bacterium]